MKKLLVLFPVLIYTSCLFAQKTADEEIISSTKNGDIRLRKMVTLNGIDANEEFKNNIARMEKARQMLIKLEQQHDQSNNADERVKLQKEIDDGRQWLNKNNKLMIERYRVTLDRKYLQVIEKSYIYVEITAEESAKINKELESKNK